MDTGDLHRELCRMRVIYGPLEKLTAYWPWFDHVDSFCLHTGTGINNSAPLWWLFYISTMNKNTNNSTTCLSSLQENLFLVYGLLSLWHQYISRDLIRSGFFATMMWFPSMNGICSPIVGCLGLALGKYLKSLWLFIGENIRKYLWSNKMW